MPNLDDFLGFKITSENSDDSSEGGGAGPWVVCIIVTLVVLEIIRWIVG